MLLAVMALGVIIVNFRPQKSKEIFKLVEGFTPPIYVLFFVLVGAKLNFSHITVPILVLIGVYLIGRTLGKMIGAKLGTKFAGAPKSVQKYLPLCLFSQAGVAIGLSILASHYFEGEMGSAVVIIITATAFILELIGPYFVKIAVTKSGEAGLNITEEDLILSTKSADIMDKNPPLIYKNTPLNKILKSFSTNNNLYYPVVENDKKLVGIITVDSIKQTLMDVGLSDFLLAYDLMEPVISTISEEASVSEVKAMLDRYSLEYLPVVTNDKKIIGFIERRVLNKLISTKIMELQRQADSLERGI